MTRKRLTVLLAGSLLCLPVASPAQRASNWRVYKLSDGLPESACVSVSLSPRGVVLARHLSSSWLSQLDGYSVRTFEVPESSSRVYESPGGQFWTVTMNGLEEYKQDSWQLHRLPEFARLGAITGGSDPVPLYPIRQGMVLCLLPERLLLFNSADSKSQSNVLRLANQTRLTKFSHWSAERNGGLWVSGLHGLARIPGPLRDLRADSPWREFVLPAELENLQEPHEDQNGGVATLAESTVTHEKVLVYFDGRDWKTQSPGIQKLRYAWRAQDQTWWAMTISGLYHSEADRPELVESEDISARQYFDVAIEPGGAFWLATSEGLYRYALLPWKAAHGYPRNGALIHCLAADASGRLWFVAAGSLHMLHQGRHEEYPLAKAGAGELQAAHALFPLKDGSLLLEADDQLAQFRPDLGTFTPLGRPETPAPKPLGLMKDGGLCMQVRSSNSPEDAYSLKAYDGSSFRPVPCPAPSIGNRLSSFLETQNGDFWLGSDQGTAWYHERMWHVFSSSDKSSPESPIAFIELPEAKVWCASSDRVWQFDGREWSEVRRGFDRINAVLRARRDGSLWVASNAGLFRYTQGTWLENGVEEGLPAVNVWALCEDQRGDLWAGTTHGLSRYDPEADVDPPRTELTLLSENPNKLRAGTPIAVSFSGQDKWKFTASERLLFSYRLDEQEWSPFQEGTHATFTDLSAGKHYLQAKAMDRSGRCDPTPAQLEFTLLLPWYKETRLLLISLAGILAALFFAAVAVNRHRQLVRSFAEVEKQVTQRTRELEIASRELLHSQKMNALGTLAAGIAHDFNNILSIIKGSAQIIEENLEDPQRVRTRVDRIKTVVEQGAGIVKAMLGFSRESEEHPAPCDINAVVEDTIRLLGDRFLREVQVRFEPVPNLPPLACAKDFVQQILINFIFNAAEAMNGRKEIILSTATLERLPAALTLSPAPADHYVAISVRDFGCGITAENMPRIFEPFFTTKAFSARRGTGLGLSMVYELARKVQAGLAVESVPDQGSTFTLIIPALNGQRS